jgi:hypothetical protein
MTGGAKPNIKSAPGQCRLRVVETETRDAIVTDVPAAADGQPHNARTIAYVAIGAESWGSLLAAAPELLELVQWMLAKVENYPIGVDESTWARKARGAIAKATS